MDKKESEVIKEEINKELIKNAESINKISSLKDVIMDHNQKGINSLNNYYLGATNAINAVKNSYLNINDLFELRLKLSFGAYFFIYIIIQFFYFILDMTVPVLYKELIYGILMTVVYYVVNIYAMSKVYEKRNDLSYKYDYNINQIQNKTVNNIDLKITYDLLSNFNDSIAKRLASIKEFLPWVPRFITAIEFESKCNEIENRIFIVLSKYKKYNDVTIKSIPYPFRNSEVSIEKYYINEFSNQLKISNMFLSLLYYKHYEDKNNEKYIFELIKNNADLLNGFIIFVKSINIIEDSYLNEILEKIFYDLDNFDSIKIIRGYNNYLYIEDKIKRFINFSKNESIKIKSTNFLDELINEKIYYLKYDDEDEYEYYKNYYLKYIELNESIDEEKYFIH